MEEYIDNILWKSNYTYTCAVCKKIIKKGDWVTKVAESKGMELKPIHLDDNGSGYIPCTGNRVIHRDCNVSDAWTNYYAYTVAQNIDYNQKNVCLYDELSKQ